MTGTESNANAAAAARNRSDEMDAYTNRKQQRGMTLAEVLVAMAIFAIIFVAALMIYDRSNRVFKSGVESAELQQNTRVAFDKMLSEIRMAGYDYDRDGFPTSAGEAQQQDEQIEYAGTHAITFRANLNFDALGTDRGRESALEIPNSQFPVVTTGNDEIVTYVLESQSGENPDTVTFFADVTDGTVAKRQTFPGGQPEDKIDIADVDLCVGGCNNPPYTLLRVTLDEKGQPVRTPLANNIRSMEFEYFTDASGSNALAIADAGGGQYNPASPGASAVPRAERSRIRAVGVTIIGMSEAPDPNFFDENEALATSPLDFTQHRKYRLETLIAARNLGKRGMREQQTAPPGQPTLDSVCFGYCGGVRLSWTAPPADLTMGSVESYVVLWDANVGTTDPPINAQQVGLTTTFLLTGLDPNTTYRFTVAATNSWGTSYADTVTGFVEGKPLNQTTPEPPANLVATGTPTPLDGQIDLSWELPGTNVGGQDSATCLTPAGGTSTPVVPAEIAEMKGIEIWRSSDINFDPSAGASTTVLAATTSGSATSYVDLSAPSCVSQYYRIRIVEFCSADEANQNISPASAYSAFYPAVGSPAIGGDSTSSATPGTPASMNVLPSSSCPGLGLSCNVDLQWPEVKQDDAGNPLGIGIYDVQIYQDGNPYDVVSNLDLSSGLSMSGGMVQYTALNLPKINIATLGLYEYTFTARAVNCGTPGDWSPSDKYPKCEFAGGNALQVDVPGALGGNGSLGSPYELDSTGTIIFSAGGATLQSVSAVAYHADNSPQGWSDSASGSATSFSLGWPGGTDDTVYRIAYTVLDASGCETSGSVYLEDVQIGCPFTVPVTFLPKLANGGNNQNPPYIDLQLKNNIALTIVVKKLQFTWNQAAADTASGNKDVTLQGVAFPTPPNNMTLTNTYVPTNIANAQSVTASAPGTTSNLAASDQTGNYKLRVVYAVQGNNNLGMNPITGATIHYRLQTDPVSLPDRTCTVFP